MEISLPSPSLPEPGLWGRTHLWRRRKLEGTKQSIREVVYPKQRRHVGVRRRLADQYLTGTGLEIGPLHLPLRVPSSATVRYVDRFGIRELREHYPELDVYDIVEPDIIDDGETLPSVPDGSVDFVIANHMIEHCEDPIGTLKTFLRVLKPGGVIYMAVPDRRFTFDHDRQVTPVSHLRRDHEEGPDWSRRQHYEEWALFHDHVAATEVSLRADDLQRRRYSIHYHVWTPSAFLDFLIDCRQSLELPLELEAVERNDHEFVVIMSRGASAP
jgi:predicted SAM-dependent methyltransferase